MFSNHLNTIPSTAGASTASMISDSWEAVNAKLQYEKHLQDMNDRNTEDAPASHYDVLVDRHNQRREFYSTSGSSSHDTSHPVSTTNKPHRSKKPSFQLPNNGALQIDDIQTNFGEIVHPAPAAFSPQFTRKHYRSNDKMNTSTYSYTTGVDGDIDSFTKHQYVESSIHSNQHQDVASSIHSNQHLPARPKTVFIPVNATVCDHDDADDKITSNDSLHIDSSSADLNSGKHNDNDKSKFLNKRAVHYNEYKVLQAMRAKMKAEEEEDDDEY